MSARGALAISTSSSMAYVPEKKLFFFSLDEIHSLLSVQIVGADSQLAIVVTGPGGGIDPKKDTIFVDVYGEKVYYRLEHPQS